ncbi:MAG TPA: toll/interleukin-1 receptor domain-containing protein [Leadbetterella sp.]|nr:toll/interleukin-1 receptor domain-containing protein [Leadbetterella sp.]
MNKKQYLAKNLISIISIVVAIASLTIFSGIISNSIVDIILHFAIGLVFSLILNFLFDFLLLKEKSVFIIYNHKDSEIVKLIATQLRQNKYEVLLDTELIKTGERISDKIDSSINKAKKIIIVISKNSANSKWVDLEIKKVLTMQKSILPIVVTEDFIIPDGMKDIKYEDLRNYDSEKINKFIVGLN